MLAALALPRVLDTLPDRRVMLPAAGALGAVLIVFAAVAWSSGAVPWMALLVTWALLGLGYSAVQTPTGGSCGARRNQSTGRLCLRRNSRSRTPAGC
jgi:hypothetical protein